jgi:hypothetical protein
MGIVIIFDILMQVYKFDLSLMIFRGRTVASLRVKAAKTVVLSQFCKLCKSENQ